MFNLTVFKRKYILIKYCTAKKMLFVLTFFLVLFSAKISKKNLRREISKILFQTENNIIFLTPLGDYFACLKQKLT